MNLLTACLATTIMTPSPPSNLQFTFGKAGTGKSYAIIKLIQTCITCRRKVMVATPTGYLATEYKDTFPEDIDAETIHECFHYPVSPTEQPSINWNLTNYDILIVDELSMVPIPMFDHMFATVSELPIRPVVVLAGDDSQLQPIETIEKMIQTTQSVMTSDKSVPKKDGVNWWQQAVKSFVTPYGKIKEVPEPANIFKRLQPFTCEWLTRPECRLSELSETITSNVPFFQKKLNDYLESYLVSKLQDHFAPLLSSMNALDNKKSEKATAKDAKKVLKLLVTDTEMDSAMDQIFQLSSSLFAVSTNYLISTALVRHPKQFAALVETKRKSAGIFKEKRSAMAMKGSILSTYEDEDDMTSSSLSKAASESVTKAFQDSSSDDDEQSSPVTTKRKGQKRKQSTVESDIQEEAPTTSGRKKSKKSKK